jgi:hypothetical protein
MTQILQGQEHGSQTQINTTGQGLGGGGGNGSSDPSVPQGVAPANYDYDIVSDGSSTGASYFVSNSSSMTSNQCVAIMSRVSAFSTNRTSSSTLNSCVASAGNFGFVTTQNSSMRSNYCIASLHKFNYYAAMASSIDANYCCAVFPFDYNVYCNANSSFNPVEFESATVFWSDDWSSFPIHFGAFGNCIVYNNSDATATRTTPSGFSGGIISNANIRFLWSDIKVGGFGTDNTANSIGATTKVSYRYVPLPHSVDYTNYADQNANGAFSNSLTNSGETTLMALIAYRDNYFSVKPPTYMFQPEDNSGTRSFNGLIGAYNISALLNQGFNI